MVGQRRNERTRAPLSRIGLVAWMLGACASGAGCAQELEATNQGAGGFTVGDGSAPDISETDASKPDGRDAEPEASLCTPKTCAQLSSECGSAPDECGGVVECGDCPVGKLCGGGGTNKCGTNACSAKTCAQVGASCGFASDGCATAIDCGGCTPPATCGATGKLNECGCKPRTCAQLGVTCGSTPDGCGSVLDCGSCPAGQTCGGGGPNLCGSSSCTPKSCSKLGASCGPASDGCSKVLDCGSCKAPDSCEGAGQPNQCGCTPKTCTQLNAACGTLNNGCNTVDCGTCVAGESCGGGGTPNQCGCTCTLAHAVTSCTAGACSITQCSPGWGDCDGDPKNGCEVDLNTSTEHCGQCSNGCVFPHATISCTAGKCEMGPCDSGRADCNADPKDGCEINLLSDVDNCKTCGHVCTAPNGTPDCKAGVCGVTSCNPGMGDCDGDASNGCETNLNTSTLHCGACGGACSTTHGTASCAAGLCGIACNTGFGNCDALVTTGCEIDLTNNATHCGTCATNCTAGPPAHTTAQTCSAGKCAVTCASGWNNTDKAWANGCECKLDAVGNSCTAATAVGPVALNGTVAYPSSTGFNTIGPSGDTDYYAITFTGAACTFNPRIQLVDLSAGHTLRMQVFNSSACSTGLACTSTETGTSSKSTGITDWQFNYSATCGSNATIDPTPATGKFATLVYYVRVYSTSSTTTDCQPYRLSITN